MRLYLAIFSRRRSDATAPLSSNGVVRAGKIPFSLILKFLQEEYCHHGISAAAGPRGNRGGQPLLAVLHCHSKPVVGVFEFGRDAGTRRRSRHFDVMPPRAASRCAAAAARRPLGIALRRNSVIR